jgi:hypothetical protein
MDFGATISRAFRIMWDYKVLWILGFLAALGGSSGNSFQAPNFTNTISSGQVSPNVVDPNLIIAGASVFACLVLIIGIVLFVVGIIARGGLIAGVQQIETQGNTTFGQSWSAGAAKFWPMLGLNILLFLPLILLIILLAVLFGGAIVGIIAASGPRGNNQNPGAAIGLLSGGLILLCCLACVLAVYALLAMALQTFGERAIILESRGVMDSISRGWSLFRDNLGNTILLALVMAVISFVIGIIAGAIVLAILLPTLFPLIGDLGRNGFVSAGRTILAVFGVLVGIVLGAIINTLFITFNSAAWTLAFRQFTGAAPVMPATSVTPPPLPTS